MLNMKKILITGTVLTAFCTSAFAASADCPPQPSRCFPKSGKKGPEEPPGGPVEAPDPQKHHQKAGRPQLPAADPKHEHRRLPVQGQQKQQIRGPCIPGPQGPEKAVAQPQLQAEDIGPGEKGQHRGRGDHPSSRRNQPPPVFPWL